MVIEYLMDQWKELTAPLKLYLDYLMVPGISLECVIELCMSWMTILPSYIIVNLPPTNALVDCVDLIKNKINNINNV